MYFIWITKTMPLSTLHLYNKTEIKKLLIDIFVCITREIIFICCHLIKNFTLTSSLTFYTPLVWTLYRIENYFIFIFRCFIRKNIFSVMSYIKIFLLEPHYCHNVAVIYVDQIDNFLFKYFCIIYPRKYF